MSEYLHEYEVQFGFNTAFFYETQLRPAPPIVDDDETMPTYQIGDRIKILQDAVSPFAGLEGAVQDGSSALTRPKCCLLRARSRDPHAGSYRPHKSNRSSLSSAVGSNSSFGWLCFPACDPVRFLPCNGSMSPTITSRWRSVSTAGTSIDPRANARHETSRYRRRHATRFENGENRVRRQIPRRGSFLRQRGPRHSAAITPGEGSLRHG